MLLAALFGFATERLDRRTLRPAAPRPPRSLRAGTVASLALALTFALERGWLTVALALMVPGIAWIADKRPLPMLRQLCIVLVGLVIARILWDPRIVGNDVGTTPILNWLLWGYGVPALSFWIGSMILRRRGDDLASRSVESAAITFTVLTVMLQIRHLMNDGDIYRAVGQPRRDRPAGLDRARHDHRARTCARAHRQHRARRRRPHPRRIARSSAR